VPAAAWSRVDKGRLNVKRPRFTAILACAVAVVTGAFAGAARGGDTEIYSFHDCVGPSGIGSFTAVKEALPESSGRGVSSASAFRLTDGSGVFVVLIFLNNGVGFSPPGVTTSGVATTTCSVGTGGLQFSGFFAQ